MNNIISIQELWEIYHLPAHIICIVDSTGCIKNANPTFTNALCYTEDNIVGKAFNDLVHPVDVKLNFTIGKDMVFQSPVHYFTNRMLSGDGSYKMFSWVISAPQSNGQIYAQAHPVIGQIGNSSN